MLLPLQGAVLTPGLEHTMSIQPTSMMGPLTQQLSHLSMGSSGTVSRLSLNILKCFCGSVCTVCHFHTCKHVAKAVQCDSKLVSFLGVFFGIIPNAAATSNEIFISIFLQYMPANTSMQGTYIPQYTQVPAANISVEVVSPCVLTP